MTGGWGVGGCVVLCVYLAVCVQSMQYSDCSPVAVYSMETDTPTAEDIQLLKKTVESEASQVQPVNQSERRRVDP